MEITRAQLAQLLRVDVSTINQWAKIGMPKAAYGKYNVFDTVGWWLDNINRDPTDEKTADARERYWNAKADQAEMQVEKERGSVISRDDVETDWAGRAMEIRAGLLSFASRLPQRLDGKDIHSMREILKEEACELLGSYSRDGKNTPKKAMKTQPAKKKKAKRK